MKNIDESVRFLEEKGFQKADVGIVLGTGLGKLLDEVEILKEVSYNHIPNFPISTVEFHKGHFIFGELREKKVIIMQGRFHVYEGYSMQEVGYPVRIMERFGICQLLISNAAGAIKEAFKKGELMLIEDHINLQGNSPLAVKGISEFGPRFVDMIEPYDPDLRKKTEAIAGEKNIQLHKGVYASVVGPQLETKAEYRYLGIIGADAVGMSTVPEVIVANQLSLPVLAVSVLTDECDPDNLAPVDIQEIMDMAAQAEPKMIELFGGLIEDLGSA